eukprot:Opistho-1_new@103796
MQACRAAGEHAQAFGQGLQFLIIAAQARPVKAEFDAQPAPGHGRGLQAAAAGRLWRQAQGTLQQGQQQHGRQAGTAQGIGPARLEAHGRLVQVLQHGQIAVQQLGFGFQGGGARVAQARQGHAQMTYQPVHAGGGLALALGVGPLDVDQGVEQQLRLDLGLQGGQARGHGAAAQLALFGQQALHRDFAAALALAQLHRRHAQGRRHQHGQDVAQQIDPVPAGIGRQALGGAHEVVDRRPGQQGDQRVHQRHGDAGPQQGGRGQAQIAARALGIAALGRQPDQQHQQAAQQGHQQMAQRQLGQARVERDLQQGAQVDEAVEQADQGEPGQLAPAQRAPGRQHMGQRRAEAAPRCQQHGAHAGTPAGMRSRATTPRGCAASSSSAALAPNRAARRARVLARPTPLPPLPAKPWPLSRTSTESSLPVRRAWISMRPPSGRGDRPCLIAFSTRVGSTTHVLCGINAEYMGA